MVHLVRFDWSGPAQAAAAADFCEWLTGRDGAAALVDVGLRPRSKPPASGRLTIATWSARSTSPGKRWNFPATV